MTIDDKPDSEALNVAPDDIVDRFERKRKRNYDGSKPLGWPELEAVAQFLATPKPIREFKTFVDLAKHFNVSRMTIYRWSRHVDVLTRAEYLLAQNQLKGDLVARLYWDRIVMGQVRAAINGDTRAAKFCENRAWPESPLV
jgi:hypothetical protein